MKQRNIIKDLTEIEINDTIRNVLINYGNYSSDIMELVAVGYPEEKAKILVLKRYKEFEIN